MDVNNLSLKAPQEEEEQEESGWTAYFEDFSNQNQSNNSLSSSFCASSMVSDASSFPAWKSFPNSYKINRNCVGESPKFPKKLRFKATRAREISHDDSLEDTASSPVNSPKVSDSGVIDENSRRQNDHFISSLGKEGSLEERYERSSCSGTNDLKKRGLCLVPLSMLVNYLG